MDHGLEDVRSDHGSEMVRRAVTAREGSDGVAERARDGQTKLKML